MASFSFFGALLVIAFCDFTFVTKHFKFLKSVTGKGYFDLFLASIFLVGDDGIWSWIMFSAVAGMGLFFVLVGCACVDGYDDSDIKKSEVAAKAKGSFSKSKNAKETDGADDNLLDAA